MAEHIIRLRANIEPLGESLLALTCPAMPGLHVVGITDEEVLCDAAEVIAVLVNMAQAPRYASGILTEGGDAKLAPGDSLSSAVGAAEMPNPSSPSGKDET